MQTTFRIAIIAVGTLGLGACSSLPPLTRSVVVQHNVTTAPATAPHTLAASSSAHANGTVQGQAYRVARGDTLYSIAFLAGVDFRQLAAWNGIPAPYVIHPGQVLQLRRVVGSSGHVTTVRPTMPTKPVPTTPAPTAMAPMFQTVPAQSPPPVPQPAPAPAAPSQVAEPVVAESTPPTQVPAPAPGSPATNLPTVVPVAGKPVAATPAAAVVTITPGKTRRVAGIEWRWPADGPLLGRFHAGDVNPGIDIAGHSGDPVRAAADGVVVYSGNGLVGYGELVIIKHNDNYLSAYGHNRKRLVKEGERVRAGQTIAEMGSSGASRNELQFQVRLNGKPMDPLDYLPSR